MREKDINIEKNLSPFAIVLNIIVEVVQFFKVTHENKDFVVFRGIKLS